MKYVTDYISSRQTAFILLLLAACVVLLILSVVLVCLVIKLKKRVNLFVGGRKDRRNLEELLLEYLEKVITVDSKYDDVLAAIDGIDNRLSFCIQKVGLVRFNPFEGMGGDLSFAAALLDEHNDGLVLCTLHGREASYTYMKPITGLESAYVLSEEEIEALRLATEKEETEYANQNT